MDKEESASVPLRKSFRLLHRVLEADPASGTCPGKKVRQSSAGEIVQLCMLFVIRFFCISCYIIIVML